MNWTCHHWMTNPPSPDLRQTSRHTTTTDRSTHYLQQTLEEQDDFTISSQTNPPPCLHPSISLPLHSIQFTHEQGNHNDKQARLATEAQQQYRRPRTLGAANPCRTAAAAASCCLHPPRTPPGAASARRRRLAGRAPPTRPGRKKWRRPPVRTTAKGAPRRVMVPLSSPSPEQTLSLLPFLSSLQANTRAPRVRRFNC